MTTQPRDYNEKPYAAIVYVTPDMARRWLLNNASNRRVKKHNVDRLARDMRAGQWKLTGEGIKFAPDGRLLDGQNRLTAVCVSGCTVPMFVFRGIDPDAQKVMDSGSARSAADNLIMSGKRNTVLVASCARLALRRELGGDTWDYRPTNSEIYQWTEDHPEVEIAAHIAAKYRANTDVTPAMTAFTAWLIGSEAGFDAAEEFWRLAHEKVGLRVNDPIIAMANAFGDLRRQRKRMDDRSQVSAILRAYNARRAGRELKLLRFTSSDRGATGQLKPIAIPNVAR